MINKSNNPPVLKPFSPPPLCKPDPRNLIKVGDNVVVVRPDGTRLKGKLHNANISPNFLEIDMEGHKDPLKVEYKSVKLINMYDLRQWVDVPSNTDSKMTIQFPHELEFSITFKDGDQLQGKTLGYNTDTNGFYLYPTQKPKHFVYIFIPHEVITSYQFGPKIGEVLVEENLVSAGIVNSALSEQQKLRKKPIGEYLKDQALVTLNELEQALRTQETTVNLKLGELLLKEKLINQEQLNAALEAQAKDRKTPLGQILVNQGKLSNEQLQRCLARKLGILYVDLTQIEVDVDALARMPENTARKYNVLPLHIYNNKIVLVMNDPLDWKTIEEIRFSANIDVIPVMSALEDITHAIEDNYSMMSLDESVFDISSIDELEGDDSIQENSAIVDNVVVRLVNKIIIDAFNTKVSDIHIEPRPGNRKTIVRMRKAGTLTVYRELSSKIRRSLVSRIKVMANLNTAERRLPQDGKINFGRYSRSKLELRVSTIPTAGDEEDVIIRLLGGGKPVPIENLMLNKDNLNCIKYVLKNPYGLFFVCGPTGSGKTTTLHSLLRHLNTPDRKIWTVEDPVEFTQDGIRQVQVHSRIGLNFATVLRSFLRADPDIIMVGEMRDKETASICVNASLTGHLVLSTLHTNSSVESVTRLLDMGIDPFILSDALLGILAQRLAKKLCPDCRQTVIADNAGLDKLAQEYCYDFQRVKAEVDSESRPDMLKQAWIKNYSDKNGNFMLYKSAGCKTCEHTGYLGRLGIHEMLMASDPVTMSISRHDPVDAILKTALEEGMRTLAQDGIEKLLQGLTDMMQVRKFSIRL